jgi:hypothetical protein
MIKVENKEALLLEFKQLNTIAQKFDFWEKKLNKNFIYYLHSIDNESMPNNLYSVFAEFMIYAKDGNESLEFNSLLIENYKFHFENLSLKKKIINLEELKSKFNLSSNDKKDFSSFIDLEIKRTEILVSEFSTPPPGSFSSKYSHFKGAFERQYFNDEDLDLSRSPYYDISNIISALNGNTIAKYLRHLKNLIGEAKQIPLKKRKGLTQEQQFLILQYLGVFDKLDKINDQTNERKGQFVGLLIDKDVSNCRTMFSYLRILKKGKTTSEKEKAKENLTKVASIFAEAGLQTIEKKVIDDLKDIDL